MQRPDGRTKGAMRPVKITTDYTMYAEGSVLVEMGFISNERECMVMADPTYQSGIAQSIADGVKAYFARSGLSYSGSGSSEAPDNSGANTGETPSEPENPGTGDTTEPETPVTPVPDDNTLSLIHI